MVENIRDASQTIGATSVEITLQQIPGTRNALVITNTSTAGQQISLAWGKAAVAGKGMVLYPGGTWSESIDTRFTPSAMGAQGIASAAGGTIAIHERITGTVV